MQERTERSGFMTIEADPDEALIKGISKDLVAAHHAGELEREIELVIALETVYFRNGRWQDASDCRASLTVLKNERHWRNLGMVA